MATTIGAARDAFLGASGLSRADYDARWVRLRVGPVPVPFPNTRARRAALPLHDLHHVATGYATTWVGEGEIAAWELAAGCGRYWAAWGLDLAAMAIGLVLAPRRVLRAFARGWRARSLYTQVPPTRVAAELARLEALPLERLRARLRVR